MGGLNNFIIINNMLTIEYVLNNICKEIREFSTRIFESLYGGLYINLGP